MRASGYDGAVRVLVENRDFPDNLFNGLDPELRIVQVPSGGKFNSRWLKTRLHEYSFAHTLFLDCDVIVPNSVNELWREVGDTDFAFARVL